MIQKLRRRVVAIAAAALMVTATAAPAFATTGNFHFETHWFQTDAINTTGTKPKSDTDKCFYVTPTGGSWTPGFDYPHAFAINVRGQECNQDTNDNLLSANNNTINIPYYAKSVPAVNQQMNIKIKEFKEGFHGYTLDGRWTP